MLRLLFAWIFSKSLELKIQHEEGVLIEAISARISEQNSTAAIGILTVFLLGLLSFCLVLRWILGRSFSTWKRTENVNRNQERIQEIIESSEDEFENEEIDGKLKRILFYRHFMTLFFSNFFRFQWRFWSWFRVASLSRSVWNVPMAKWRRDSQKALAAARRRRRTFAKTSQQRIYS